MQTMFFGILAGQLIFFGICYITENNLHKKQPIKSFWRRRWRTILLGAAIAIHVINIAFLHGSGLLYLG